MSGEGGLWAQALERGSTTSAQFEDLLRQRIDRDYELDEDLVNHIMEQLRVFNEKQQLEDELLEVFGEEGAEPMASWCVLSWCRSCRAVVNSQAVGAVLLMVAWSEQFRHAVATGAGRRCRTSRTKSS